MATNLLPIHPIGVRTSAVPGHWSSDNRRLKVSNAANNATGNGNGNWWSPLFGWSADADYIDSSKKEDPMVKPVLKSETDPDPKQARSKFSPGCFTAEKAKQLRMMTMDTASFHDVMYHSAIASRLASDFSGRSGQ